MSDFKFTKAFINNDNMNGINPFLKTKQDNIKSDNGLQPNNDYRNVIESLRNIKKD